MTFTRKNIEKLVWIYLKMIMQFQEKNVLCIKRIHPEFQFAFSLQAATQQSKIFAVLLKRTHILSLKIFLAELKTLHHLLEIIDAINEIPLPDDAILVWLFKFS